MSNDKPKIDIVENISTKLSQILRDNPDLNEKEKTYLGLQITGIYENPSWKSGMRIYIFNDKIAFPVFQIGNGRYRMTMNIATQIIHIEKSCYESIRDFIVQNKTYLLECMCAVFFLILMVFSGYTTEDILRLLLIVSGIDAKLHGAISAMSNKTE